MTIAKDENDPYERIIQTMKKEYVHSIPLVDGKVSEAYCCSILKPITRYEDKFEHSIAKANYISKVDQELCKGCELCAKRCPFEAITIKDEKAFVDDRKCYGCGVCAVTCPTEAIKLHRFEHSHIFESGMEMMAQMKKDNLEN